MSCYDSIMSSDRPSKNRVRALRSSQNWSQAELAERAGVSRAAVSAIEIGRLVPSVTAALSISAVFGCSVEELFGTITNSESTSAWAWKCPVVPCRYWQAQVGGRVLHYPVEGSVAGSVPHDGVWDGRAIPLRRADIASKTLVMASCDPAAGLLANEAARLTGLRLLVFPRSSQKALSLLAEGAVHVAGVHLATEDDPDGNADAVKAKIQTETTLLRVAKWQEGLAVSPQARVRSVQQTLRSRLRWVGREVGSGARQCMDNLLETRPRPRRIASDHRGVAEAVRCGWADVGVCLQLVCEEAGLRFLGVRQDTYDLCFASDAETDPRLQALLRTIRSSTYRKLLSELPGYDPSEMGQMQRVR